MVELAARVYSVELMRPSPVEFSFWPMIASMPAKIGAAKLVPPATVRYSSLLSLKPLEQLLVMLVAVESLEQYR